MPEDLLERILQTWKVEPEIPTTFETVVWRRIAVAQTPNRVWGNLMEWLLQPRHAYAAIVLSILIGLSSAYVARRFQTEAPSDPHAYYDSINPFLHVE